MTTVYLAGRITARERLKDIRIKIRKLGYRCESTWLDTGRDYPISDKDMRMAASLDMQELSGASIFLLDTIDISQTGGREVELGLAFSHCQLILIGPIRNLYHALIPNQFERWDEALEFLQKLKTQ